MTVIGTFLMESVSALYWVGCVIHLFYCEKNKVLKAGICLNALAWNNKIGLCFYFVGSEKQSND